MSFEKSGDDGNDSASVGTPDTTRRKLMAAGAATWATVGLAGCASGGGQSETTTTATTTKPKPKQYVYDDEVLVGSHGDIPKDAGMVSSCSPTNKFMPGMQAVWHVGVYDPATGDPVGNDTIDSMSIQLDNGKSVEMAWAGDDEEHAEPIWKGSWTIPKDASAGKLKYDIKVGDGDAKFQDVEVSSNELSIITDFHPKNYVVTDELIASGSIPKDEMLISGCSTSRTFAPGMELVFHIGVYDPATGKQDPIDNNTISKMTVEMSNGVTVDMQWAGDDKEHAEPIWKGSWAIPKDAKPKDVTYDIKITDENDRFHDVNVEKNHFTIVKG